MSLANTAAASDFDVQTRFEQERRDLESRRSLFVAPVVENCSKHLHSLKTKEEHEKI